MEKNFIELLKEGKVTIEDIDDYIDMWHGSDSKLSLPEFLGMTNEEYAMFVTKCKIE